MVKMKFKESENFIYDYIHYFTWNEFYVRQCSFFFTFYDANFAPYKFDEVERFDEVEFNQRNTLSAFTIFTVTI